MASNSSFVHLHVHTEYSMLDGHSLLDGLFERTAELQMPAIAMTDHGNVHGAYDFWSKARKHGINPIIGMEAYLTPGTARSEKKRVRWGSGRGESAEERGDDVAGGGAYTHMTILAETTEGMHNLFRIASRSSLEGFYYKPRADRELLAEHAKGLIATTGCPSGEIQTRLRLGQWEEAKQAAADYQDIFGRENYFMELMDHEIEIEARVREDLLRLARELQIPLIATNDSHYTNPTDAKAHDALICVASGKRLSDKNRLQFDGSGYHIKSAAEMRELWEDKHGLAEACDNTLLIAERCSVEFEESIGGHMARADIPADHTEASWFRAEVWRGIEARYGTEFSDEVRARTELELDVIEGKGYCGYYLVVADFINWAKANGIRVGPGRGSGAGSIAAYALRITDLCPIENGLIFERFLNPERPSMPDFDIDFDDRRRGEVIAYVTEKYGSDKVAQIATFGRLKAKAAIKDAARILDHPFAVSDRITKSLPADVMGKGVALTELFDEKHKRYADGAPFRELHASDAVTREVYEIGLGLEGQIRQWGVHAAGVIMSDTPLIDIVPIMKREQDGAIITQFDYPMCEALGLVKMDFLGLRNLTVLDDALANIRANKGIDIVLEDLPFDDPETYALLARGDTLGVFQLDGGPMRQLLRQMQPDNFEDISAALALYRPGPMGANSHTNYALRKTGLQKIDYIHPDLTEALEPILGQTYGVIVYQEQVMTIAQELAGYTLGQADNLRRAMGKKDRKVLDAEFVTFEAGMRERGFDPKPIRVLWEVLVPFADYAFNKAHSAAYGVISYWTAWLKAHHTPEFMAALLTSVKGDKDKSALYLSECRRLGINVLPPDVNESMGDFASVGTDIRFGLTAVRNVGTNVVAGIVEAREQEGPFANFTDFLDKVPVQVCNKRVLDSLIKAGAFDSMGHTRRSLVTIAEDAVEQYIDLKRNAAIGQDSLFGGIDDSAPGLVLEVPTLPEWEKMHLLGLERDMLGLYVSDHPLAGMDSVLRANSDIGIADLLEAEGLEDGHTTRLAGLITNVERRLTKQGKTWANVTIEDLDGSVQVAVFPGAYDLAHPILTTDSIVVAKVRLRHRDEGIDLSAIEITQPDLGEGAADRPVVLVVSRAQVTTEVTTRLHEVLRAHPGMAEVRLRLRSKDSELYMRVNDDLRVAPSPALFSELKALLGAGCLE